MSLQPAGNSRSRNTLLRDLATQAAGHPRIEAAVIGAIRDVLPGVIEELLRQSYGGETVRIYAPRHDVMLADQVRRNRDLRIATLAAAPSSLPAAAIAKREGVTPHRVRQILRAMSKSGSCAP